MNKQQQIEQIEQRAKALAEYCKIEGGAVVVDKEAYNIGAPDILTDEVHKALSEHNSIFLPAITQVVAQASQKIALDNAEIERVVTTVPMHGRDSYKLTWDKSATRVAPGSTTEVTTYGQVRGTLKSAAASTSRAGMSHVLEGIHKAAMEAFGS